MLDIIQNKATYSSVAQQQITNSKYRSEKALRALAESSKNEFHSFWSNPLATPSEQLAIMGTKAAAAFVQHGRVVTFLLQSGVPLSPDDYTPPLAYTTHQDGTITLN